MLKGHSFAVPDELDLEEEEDEKAFGERPGLGLDAPFTRPAPQKAEEQPGLASELEAL